MTLEGRQSEEQQAFRWAVRTWLDQNTPANIAIPADFSALDQETQTLIKEFRVKLGAKGWLAPTWPHEYGGGGMAPAAAEIIQQELSRLRLPTMGDNYRWIPAVMSWGTEEQKQRFVVPCLRGETITWQAFNESNSGSDLASVSTQAIWDGDDFVINGEKSFITGRFDPDYLWTLAVTDPELPKHSNLGVLMVDAKTPGIEIKTLRLLAGSERKLTFDDVLVPGTCLVGAPTQGWEIAQAILEQERGGRPEGYSQYDASDDFDA